MISNGTRNLIRPVRFMLVLVCVIAPTARAQEQVGAGGEEGAWVCVPVLRSGAVIQHLDPHDPGAASRAVSLPSSPAFMAAGDNRLVLIFRLSEGTSGGPTYQVREIRFERLIPHRPFTYQPQMPLAPLPEGARVRSVRVIDRHVYVLSEDDLLRLDGHGWESLSVPPELGDRSALRMVALDGRLVLIEMGADESTGWVLADDTGSEWDKFNLAPAPPDALIVGLGSHLVLGEERDGKLEVALWRPEAMASIASLEPRAPQQWIVPLGDNLAVVWSDGATSPKLGAHIISPTGLVMHDGPVRTAPPVGVRELEVLAVLLASTVLSVAVFIFRPVLTPRTPIRMPKGWVIAEPWKRGFAGTLDVAVGLVAASVIWKLPLTEMTNPASPGFSEVGIWPLLTAAGVVIVLSAVGEATTGRTLGKALLGIRTISFLGKRPGLGVSLLRSVVKVLCPPLALASLLGVPPEASPTSFGTLIISRRAIEEPPTPKKDEPD